MPAVDSAKPARLLPQIVLLHMILQRPVQKHVEAARSGPRIVLCLQMDLKTKEELGVPIHEASAISCCVLHCSFTSEDLRLQLEMQRCLRSGF